MVLASPSHMRRYRLRALAPIETLKERMVREIEMAKERWRHKKWLAQYLKKSVTAYIIRWRTLGWSASELPWNQKKIPVKH